MILAGDIGGTKTNLALINFKQNKMETVFFKQFSSKNYSTFFDLLDEFLPHINNITIDVICLGVAAPIINGTATLTNLPWKITTKQLEDKFYTSKVSLLNDLEAMAYGMIYLKSKDFIELNPHAKQQKGTIGVIAAGTGLGEAILYYDGTQYHPLATEGSHSDFAPCTKQQDKLLEWLRVKYPDHVSYERVISGEGISNIYNFLVNSNFALECNLMKNISKEVDKNEMITKCALNLNDKLSLETLRLFLEIYGAEAGNLALKSMGIGGILIGGGIAPKILPLINNGVFLNSFIKKGRFESLLKDISIKVVLNEQTALLGSARYAYDKIIGA
jgi:glucokinase